MKSLINLFFAASCIFFNQDLSAQQERRSRQLVNSVLAGKIIDEASQQPLPGASIYLHEAKVGAIADINGYYRLSNLPAGKFLVEVSHRGFGVVTESVEIKGDIQKDFSLSPEVVENQGVTVTGVSGATPIKKAPIPVTIIRRENLLREASTNLIDALSKVPGVSQVSTGPAISKPSIRGLGYNRVVVINDGIRQEGQQWGDEHGIEIDEYAVNKAEVLKGPASIMYGSDALAGVVNFVSVISPPQGTIRGNLVANYQNNNRLRAFHGDLGGAQHSFIWGLNGTYKAASDYKNKFDGYVFNSKFIEKDLSGYIGLNKNWGFTHLLLSSFKQEPGLVEGDRDAATGRFIKLVNNNGVEQQAPVANEDLKSIHPFIPKQLIRHFKITSVNSFNVGRDRLLINLAFQRNQREEFSNVLRPSETSLYFDLKTINYSIQYQWAEKKNWKTSIGVNGMQQTNLNKGLERLIPEYDLFDIGAFLFTRRTINNITVSGGLRIDNRSLDSRLYKEGSVTRFDAFKRNFSNISASAGMSWQAADNIIIKLNLAHGFRAPGIAELASNGAHEGSFRYEYGEQQLKSENSFQADAGVDLNNEHVSFAASLFYNSVRNFIFYRKLSSVNGSDSVINSGGQDLFVFRFSQSNAILYGAEFNLDIHPHPLDWLHFENTFSYVRGKLAVAQDGSNNLPFIPAARLINELRADFLRKGRSVRNTYVTAELDNNFTQNKAFTGFNTETATDGYTLLNLGLGADIMSREKVLVRVFLVANNITNLAYQTHLSRLKYAPVNVATGRTGIFSMGRNFSIKLNIPLNFAVKVQ